MPILGAINGAAYGGGTELTLACDLAYAAKHARFALTETTLGIMPGMAGTQYLPRAVGIRRAKEIILTGRPFSAEQALEWGLVNELCEPEALLELVRAPAQRIADNGPIAIQGALKAINNAGFASHLSRITRLSLLLTTRRFPRRIAAKVSLLLMKNVKPGSRESNSAEGLLESSSSARSFCAR